MAMTWYLASAAAVLAVVLSIGAYWEWQHRRRMNAAWRRLEKVFREERISVDDP